MSHIVQIQTEVRDATAVAAACQRLGLAVPRQAKVQLFTSTETGLAVQLPGWRYPIVCDLASGALKYDDYQGHWGEPRELDRFLQAYVVEKARLEARKQGHTARSSLWSDGSIKLTIQVGA